MVVLTGMGYREIARRLEQENIPLIKNIFYRTGIILTKLPYIIYRVVCIARRNDLQFVVSIQSSI